MGVITSLAVSQPPSLQSFMPHLQHQKRRKKKKKIPSIDTTPQHIFMKNLSVWTFAFQRIDFSLWMIVAAALSRTSLPSCLTFLGLKSGRAAQFWIMKGGKKRSCQSVWCLFESRSQMQIMTASLCGCKNTSNVQQLVTDLPANWLKTQK